MDNTLFGNIYNPDVLSCLANLSNDEVFTPPEIVNQMLDMLPQELFQNPDTTFLDPACKTGVFLREIAKRLIKGLKPQFPDLQERIDHIFHKQLFGIAITELTSLLSRRGVYCSKYPNSQFSVSLFNTADGNIRYKRINHTWKNGKCIFCGASQQEYERNEELETHAYEFIHVKDLESLFNMKFDVIISNPPYQLSDGGGTGSSAMPIYQYFVEKAKILNPRYIVMITPSRWFAGGKGLDEYRNNMLHDNRIRVIHDFIDASTCFPGVEIKGGVSYFLWSRDSKGLCKVYTHNDTDNISFAERPLLEENSDVFIRYNDAIEIIKKVQKISNTSFSKIVSTRNPFGFASNFSEYSNIENKNSIKIYAMNKRIGYLPKSTTIQKNVDLINKWKLLVSKAVGTGNIKTDWIKPIIAEPSSVCTETYLVIGGFDTEDIAKNVYTYTQTKFFHFLFGLGKITQNTTSKSYQFVPMQDFSKPWTDKELYAKYNLTQEEIDFIESMIKPME